LSGDDLSFANFPGAQCVDCTPPSISGASCDPANLVFANFTNANLSSASFFNFTEVQKPAQQLVTGSAEMAGAILTGDAVGIPYRISRAQTR
jgi:uncharacterized protein YjbI with pentapeptide repeats